MEKDSIEAYLKVLEFFGPPISKRVLLEKTPAPDIVLKRGKKVRKFWTNKYGELHSKNGNPAEIKQTGTEVWYKNGWRHRGGDMPAEIVYDSGTMVWYRNGVVWREGLKPAMITVSNVYWYECGIQAMQMSTCDVAFMLSKPNRRFKKMMDSVAICKKKIRGNYPENE